VGRNNPVLRCEKSLKLPPQAPITPAPAVAFGRTCPQSRPSRVKRGAGGGAYWLSSIPRNLECPTALRERFPARFHRIPLRFLATGVGPVTPLGMVRVPAVFVPPRARG